jgi:hypothetical protein
MTGGQSQTLVNGATYEVMADLDVPRIDGYEPAVAESM